MICFTEVRFLQTYSPLRRPQRSGLFQPLPSLKRSLGPSELLFSIKREQTSSQGPPNNWCLLPWLQLSFDHKKEWERRKWSKRKSSKEHNKSLSLITKALCGVGRGFDLFGVSCIECYSSCKWLRSGKLGWLECGGGWGIYSPNHQTSRLVEAAVAWRTRQLRAPRGG